ncbi:hypothetical protein EJ110_NYTH07497 [Nymphaea thermarum]|nr:hypothetical protein EJ110_NYTH07497 [Nymphaea thermarum]
MNFHKSANKMSTPQKKVIGYMIESPIKPSKVMEVFAHEAGEKHHNNIYRIDSQKMVNYIKQRRDENLEFYFNI